MICFVPGNKLGLGCINMKMYLLLIIKLIYKPKFLQYLKRPELFLNDVNWPTGGFRENNYTLKMLTSLLKVINLILITSINYSISYKVLYTHLSDSGVFCFVSAFYLLSIHVLLISITIITHSKTNVLIQLNGNIPVYLGNKTH